ncbi:MAG: M24 family metallopeptidase, partial [Myxococcales bacterium]
MSFRERRAAVLKAMGQGVAVCFAAPVFVRNNDVEHEYRQDSDFYYLTGFDEPESVIVLVADGQGGGKFVLFVRPSDPEREVWDGRRAGVEGAIKVHGADEAYPIEMLDKKLAELMRGQPRLYFRLGRHRPHDEIVLRVLEHVRARGRAPHGWPTAIVELDEIVHEMRWRKDGAEQDVMQRAADITADGHLAAMARARPGGREYELEAVLREAYRRHGAERCAYQPIVGAGANATTLHYRANADELRDGDLVLIDSGAEYGYYACDVTRTFPVNGRFTPTQRAAYQVVLDAQLASIAACRPGCTLDEVHQASLEVLVEGMVKLGLLAGDPAKLLADGAYKPYYMHRTSHFLGMDVHDVGTYFAAGKPRPLDPGVVLTVEPGLYISPRDERAPAELRGLG